MGLIGRILACEGCGYSGSTFGNADWLTVGMACPNGCGGKVIAFVPEQPRGAVDALRPFAVPDSEFMDEDGIQVCVGVTRAEAAAIRAIVGGQ